MKASSVMIIETDAAVRSRLRHAFVERGYKTWTCPGLEMADTLFIAARPEIILMDWDGRDGRAIELLDDWKKTAPETRVLIESDTADTPRMKIAKEHGADAFLIKSLSLATLFHLIENEMPSGRHFKPHAA